MCSYCTRDSAPEVKYVYTYWDAEIVVGGEADVMYQNKIYTESKTMHLVGVDGHIELSCPFQGR